MVLVSVRPASALVMPADIDMTWRDNDGKGLPCGSITDRRRRGPWTVTETEEVFGIKGKDLIRIALDMCRVCPQQYNCARFAVSIDAESSTYAMPIDDLRKLLRGRDGKERAMTVIDDAELRRRPVAVAVAAAVAHIPSRSRASA